MRYDIDLARYQSSGKPREKPVTDSRNLVPPWMTGEHRREGMLEVLRAYRESEARSKRRALDAGLTGRDHAAMLVMLGETLGIADPGDTLEVIDALC